MKDTLPVEIPQEWIRHAKSDLQIAQIAMTPGNLQFTFKRSLPGNYLIWLLIGCCLLSTFGCILTGREKVPFQTTVTPKPSSTVAPTLIMTISATSTSTYTPTFTPNPASDSTQVIEFHPEGVPTQERTGSCWSTSNVLNRIDAWRCIADNSIYDPCFNIPGNSQAVICDASPLSGSTGFKLNLTESLPARGSVSPVKSAWAFELADGTKCIFMGGATASFEGERVNYSCSDGWVILGELQEGQVWTARKVRLSSDFSSIEESVQVFIMKVWL